MSLTTPLAFAGGTPSAAQTAVTARLQAWCARGPSKIPTSRTVPRQRFGAADPLLVSGMLCVTSNCRAVKSAVAGATATTPPIANVPAGQAATRRVATLSVQRSVFHHVLDRRNSVGRLDSRGRSPDAGSVRGHGPGLASVRVAGRAPGVGRPRNWAGHRQHRAGPFGLHRVCGRDRERAVARFQREPAAHCRRTRRAACVGEPGGGTGRGGGRGDPLAARRGLLATRRETERHGPRDSGERRGSACRSARLQGRDRPRRSQSFGAALNRSLTRRSPRTRDAPPASPSARMSRDRERRCPSPLRGREPSPKRERRSLLRALRFAPR